MDSLIAYVDHCFKIKNKGTVATGTIMRGCIKVNDEMYFPELSNKYMELVDEAKNFNDMRAFDNYVGFQGWQFLLTGNTTKLNHHNYLTEEELKEISTFCYMAWLEAHDIGRTILFD